MDRLVRATTGQANVVTYEPLTRERAIQDGEALAVLGADNSWENWTVENLLSERPFKWELSLLAVGGGKPVGYAVASYTGDVVHLHHLIVGLEWRGRGIGRELLCRLALKAQEMAVRKLSLKVHRQNQRAIAFYTRYGFEISEENRLALFRMIGVVNEIVSRAAS